MPLTVLLFGPLAAKAGARSLAAEGATPSALRDHIAAAHPDLAPLLKTARFAVNQSFVAEDHPLTPSDEIALIPPVSGGVR